MVVTSVEFDGDTMHEDAGWVWRTVGWFIVGEWGPGTRAQASLLERVVLPWSHGRGK